MTKKEQNLYHDPSLISLASEIKFSIECGQDEIDDLSKDLKERKKFLTRQKKRLDKIEENYEKIHGFKLK